jgi:DNA polymerase III subunit delta'
MPIVPLHGHQTLRARLADALSRGILPQSLLLHGESGVGKQRLALWLAQSLLCDGPIPPCGQCRHCQYSAEIMHPDLQWVFPRPKLKDADPSLDDIKADLMDAVRERAAHGGLYAPPPSAEQIYVATTRLLVQLASITPAMARRKVFVVGEADRMSPPQENAEAPAANAFLKLLEEPPADTFIILTSSAPGALLPTIRSRVVAVRVAPLAPAEVRDWMGDPQVQAALEKSDLPRGADERVRLAAGAPGRLLAAKETTVASTAAHRMLEVALSNDRAKALRLSMAQGMSGARGTFSDILDALTAALHQRTRLAVERQDERAARNAARAVAIVEESKLLAGGNVNPQLVTASLLSDLSRVLSS